MKNYLKALASGKIGEWSDSINFGFDFYINAGVIVYNLKKMRECSRLPILKDCISDLLEVSFFWKD